MKIKANYITIPLITIMVAVIGSQLTGLGMSWYKTALIQPDLTPPSWVFPIAWNTIFILTTASALIFWNKEMNEFSFLYWKIKKRPSRRTWTITTLFILNAILNVLWSYLFFLNKMILTAFIEMLFLEATIIALMILLYKISKTASLLLIPYALWVSIATYLTYQICSLNC